MTFLWLIVSTKCNISTQSWSLFWNLNQCRGSRAAELNAAFCLNKSKSCNMVCGLDTHSERIDFISFNFFTLVFRQIAALSFATQHAVPGKRGAKDTIPAVTSAHLVMSVITLKLKKYNNLYSQWELNQQLSCVQQESAPLCRLYKVTSESPFYHFGYANIALVE